MDASPSDAQTEWALARRTIRELGAIPLVLIGLRPNGEIALVGMRLNLPSDLVRQVLKDAAGQPWEDPEDGVFESISAPPEPPEAPEAPPCRPFRERPPSVN